MKITPQKFDQITSNLQEFNKFLEEFKQEIFLSIPEIVLRHIEEGNKAQKLVSKFYKKNPELQKHRVLIGSLANKIASDNPELSSEEVFNLTAKKATKVLKEGKYEAI